MSRLRIGTGCQSVASDIRCPGTLDSIEMAENGLALWWQAHGGPSVRSCGWALINFAFTAITFRVIRCPNDYSEASSQEQPKGQVLVLYSARTTIDEMS